jgi:hypothetical protein
MDAFKSATMAVADCHSSAIIGRNLHVRGFFRCDTLLQIPELFAQVPAQIKLESFLGKFVIKSSPAGPLPIFKYTGPLPILKH